MSQSIAISTASAKRIIDRAWWDLSRACESHFSHDLQDALDTEMSDERGHRRMGARFTNGSAQYRLSAEYAAKLFIVRNVFDAPTSVDLADLGGLRTAVTKCYILAARMRKTRDYRDAESPTLWDKFIKVVREKRYAHDKPGIMTGGKIIDLPEGALRSEFVKRTDNDTSLMRSGPMFMALDYAVDIAVH